MDQDLKQLTPVDISKVWETEPQHFTPWLAREENLTLLGNTLGMELELEAQEVNIGGSGQTCVARTQSMTRGCSLKINWKQPTTGMWDNFSHTPRDWMRIPLSGLPRRSGRSIVRCLTGRIG